MVRESNHFLSGLVDKIRGKKSQIVYGAPINKNGIIMIEDSKDVLKHSMP